MDAPKDYTAEIEAARAEGMDWDYQNNIPCYPPMIFYAAPPRPSSPVEDATIKAALKALATEKNLFVHHDRLAEIVGSRIVPLNRYTLRQRFFANRKFRKFLHEKKYKHQLWLEPQLLRRTKWPKVPVLKAIIETPMLRPDGSLLDTPGYDATTGLYLTTAMTLTVPEQPTQEDARAAHETLLRLTKPLPFSSSTHATAFLASLLTPFARLAVESPAPLFVFDSPTDRVPSLLADAVSLIVRGKPMLRMEKPPSDRVFRRRLAQTEAKQETLVLLEGAETFRSGSALGTALSGRGWVDGDARTKDALPVIWYSATNNVALSGEVSALVLPIRTEATEDDEGTPLWTPPRGFERRLLDERAPIVSACLTLLRAYVIAGKPEQEITAFSRFEAWAELVAGALVWAGASDPLRTRRAMDDYVDDDRLEVRDLLRGLGQLEGNDQGLTVWEILSQVRSDDPRHKYTREALDLLRPGEWWKPRILAAILKKLRGKRIGVMYVERVGEDGDHLSRWAARIDQRPVPQPEVPQSESPESIHATESENSEAGSADVLVRQQSDVIEELVPESDRGGPPLDARRDQCLRRETVLADGDIRAPSLVLTSFQHGLKTGPPDPAGGHPEAVEAPGNRNSAEGCPEV